MIREWLMPERHVGDATGLRWCESPTSGTGAVYLRVSGAAGDAAKTIDREGVMKALVIALALAATPAVLAAQDGRHARQCARDRAEDVRDRREDRRDRAENVRDRREDRRDRAEDRRDARHHGGARDRAEDVIDRREDHRDRAEDRRDRRENVGDRREDRRDRRHGCV